MTEKVCLKIIANKYDSLSTVERALCDYILKNPSEVLKMTAAEFGRAAGSAPASIIRLCRDLGFDGFTDFKTSPCSVVGRGRGACFARGKGDGHDGGDFPQGFCIRDKYA